MLISVILTLADTRILSEVCCKELPLPQITFLLFLKKQERERTQGYKRHLSSLESKITHEVLDP